MRKVILQVAVSLDGFIEDAEGKFDWCFMDDDYGMTEYMKRIDSIVMGRKTYELVLTLGGETMPGFPKVNEYIVSTTLSKLEGDRILVNGNLDDFITDLKQQPGKDIWLFGGASLTTYFMNNGHVDEIELAVHPILLGSGKPLFQNIDKRIKLTLLKSKPYPSGLIMLSYAVNS
ncbi:MAG: dihydrofolate reductase [Sphingobacteriales bacterium]|nr:MAG: dihydrofolate reductase [Sphingobacteriales bacterium]